MTLSITTAAIGILVALQGCTSRPLTPQDAQLEDAASSTLQSYCRGDDPRVTISGASFPVSNKVTLLPYQTNNPDPPPTKPLPPFLGFTFHGRTPDGAPAVLVVGYDDDGSLVDQPIPSKIAFSGRPNAKISFARVTYPDAGMAWQYPTLDELASDTDTFIGWVARPVQYNYAVCIFAAARDPAKHGYLTTVLAYTSKISAPN